MDPTCFTSSKLAPSFTLRFWATILLADGADLETLNFISHLITVIKNNTHRFWEKGANFSLPLEEAERIREVVEAGRREEGEEEELLFKASLNGEGEVFLGSLEYMVNGAVMVSADAVHSSKAHIYWTMHRGPSAIAAYHAATASPDRLLFIGCARARQTIRQLMFKFCENSRKREECRIYYYILRG
jgi:hypothetical protein